MYAPLAGKPRSFGRGLLLTIVTLGIYSLYWNAKAHKEVYDQERRSDWPLGMFLCGILIPFVGLIFYIIYQVRVFDTLNNARVPRGLPRSIGGGEFLLWSTLGILIIVGPFIAYYKAQKSLNEYWDRCQMQNVPVQAAPPQAIQQVG